MVTNESEEQVGYGKPPKRSQFRRGQSGNPKGRPKGSKNLANLLAKALTEKVVIREDGKRRTVTKGEAAIGQLVDKATLGDLSAMRLLAVLVSTMGKDASPGPKYSTASESDQKIMQRLLEKMKQSRRTKNDDDN